ncbi:MAG: type secretion system protein GspF [Pseudomonadota bacterium]
MSAFRYKALNAEGKLVKGVLEGDSDRHVRAILRERRLKPVAVESAGSAGAKAGRDWRSVFTQTKVSTADLALLTRQLATLIQSNMPIDESLRATAEQSRKPRIKALMLQVRARVAEGHTLAYALGEYPAVFDDMYRAMVSAGEHAGFLAQVLMQLADYTERRQYTQQKLMMALIYPFILLGVAVSVVVALMIYVVPELVGIFAHTNSQLPPLTVALIAVSDFLQNSGLWLLLAIIVLVFSWGYWVGIEANRKRWHRVLLKLPFASGVVIAMDTARFASTLSILMASGVPLLEGLRIASAVLTNRVLRDDAEAVAIAVEEGGSLHRALGVSGRFPPMMVHMVASGEASGELEQMLERSATNQERELEMTMGTVSALFEPLMVVFMGGMVLTIVLAILLPIFDLNSMVR